MKRQLYQDARTVIAIAWTIGCLAAGGVIGHQLRAAQAEAPGPVNIEMYRDSLDACQRQLIAANSRTTPKKKSQPKPAPQRKETSNGRADR